MGTGQAQFHPPDIGKYQTVGQRVDAWIDSGNRLTGDDLASVREMRASILEGLCRTFSCQFSQHW